MEDLKAKAQSQILTFGILGIVFGAMGGLLGIIFSAIGLSKAKKYVAEGNELTGKAKTGKILATVGLILAIVALVFTVIFSVVGGVASSALSQYAVQ